MKISLVELTSSYPIHWLSHRYFCCCDVPYLRQIVANILGLFAITPVLCWICSELDVRCFTLCFKRRVVWTAAVPDSPCKVERKINVCIVRGDSPSLMYPEGLYRSCYPLLCSSRVLNVTLRDTTDFLHRFKCSWGFQNVRRHQFESSFSSEMDVSASCYCHQFW